MTRIDCDGVSIGGAHIEKYPSCCARHMKYAEMTAGLHQSDHCPVGHQPDGKTPEKFNTQRHSWIIQQEAQNKKEANSSKYRQEQIKRSRLPFASLERQGE